jgi:hypothetical protein
MSYWRRFCQEAYELLLHLLLQWMSSASSMEE